MTLQFKITATSGFSWLSAQRCESWISEGKHRKKGHARTRLGLREHLFALRQSKVRQERDERAVDGRAVLEAGIRRRGKVDRQRLDLFDKDGWERAHDCIADKLEAGLLDVLGGGGLLWRVAVGEEEGRGGKRGLSEMRLASMHGCLEKSLMAL